MTCGPGITSGPEAAALHGTDIMLPSPWRVAERWEETHDTFGFALEPLDDDSALAFRPGQFNMLYAFGAGESAISVSGDPAASVGERRLVHTIREAGEVTRALGRLRPGDELGLRGPFGTAWPLEEMRGRDLVFVAGGIGLAPLRPALYAAVARRRDFGRIVLLVGARSPDDLLYAAELEAWDAEPGVEVRVTVDRAEAAWSGSVGVVTKLVERAAFDPAEACGLVCGPEIMMRFAADSLRRAGLPEERTFLTMERNMKCAVGLCGHCQYGPEFICRDGPVYPLGRVRKWFSLHEL